MGKLSGEVADLTFPVMWAILGEISKDCIC